LGDVLKTLQDSCEVSVPADQLAALDMLQVSASRGAGKTRAALVVSRKGDASAMAFAQQHDFETQQVATKNGQCQDAANLVGEAGLILKVLDQALETYLVEFSLKGQKLTGSLEEIWREREHDLTSARAARQNRANDLAVAEGDKKESEKNLALAQEAKQMIERKCSVKETDEERMARRQDEIEALKSALKVLNGEEIPVGFLATGVRGGLAN